MTAVSAFCKTFAGILAISLLAFTFAGCGKKGEETEEETGKKATKQTEEKGAEDLRKGKAAYEIRDYKTAAMCFSLAAQDGNAEAQYRLGRCYWDGKGVDKNLDEYERWIRKAAEQGFPKAEIIYGDCFRSKRDKESLAEAESWVKKGITGLIKEAKQGDAEAQYLLGGCYLCGVGVELDEAEGMKWFRKAAEQGDAEALYRLGICYQWGDGVDKNMEEAVKWYRKAADRDHVYACSDLGECYENGNGVRENKVEAVKWYRKAAELNNGFACFRLGECYENGKGVKRDWAEAVKWYRRAIELGDTNADRALRRFEKK